MNPISRRRHGFTLVELLVVVGIITILAGMIFAAAKSARNSANRTICTSNLHQIGVAIEAYAADNSGELPAVYGLSYAHGRPTSWCNIGMHKEGIGCGGLLLLVSQPVGLASRGYLPDASLFHCPGDSVYVPPRGNEVISYLYCYVPRGGGFFSNSGLQPQPLPIDPTQYRWIGGLLAGLERHGVSIANAAATAILVEETAAYRTGPTGKTWVMFHGAGGNILYFDGHVAGAAMDLPHFGPGHTREYFENMFASADHAGL